ncbi:MAG: hypothetical protein K9K38_10660 [Rhodoferax sp.]|nr:hypothetical protein [Rhodoferax sp.]MCF8209850.1 hypothetical protein [Rhodoferax sp.]
MGTPVNAGRPTYALAKETGLPLFLQSADSINTAIANAMTLLGYDYSDNDVAQPQSFGDHLE